jgi:tetratricopeptide (TPR) repeat protein
MRARFWLGAFFITGSILSAQPAPSCNGPAEMERNLAAKPSPEAYNAKGAYFAEKKQLSCAIAAFESAIRLDPNSADSHFNLALALREKRELKRAIKELQAAVRLQPDLASAQCLRHDAS